MNFSRHIFVFAQALVVEDVTSYQRKP